MEFTHGPHLQILQQNTGLSTKLGCAH